MKPNILILSSTQTANSQSVPMGREVMEEGIPKKKFKKDVICSGHFKHPLAQWELDIDTARMNTWVENFKKMKEAGIKVSLNSSHVVDSETFMGYVDNLYVEEDKLFSEIIVTGESAITQAYRVGQVSMGLNTEYEDSKGIKYGEAITHIALTPCPVVNSQEEFKEMNFAVDYDLNIKPEEKKDCRLESKIDKEMFCELYDSKLSLMLSSGYVTPAEKTQLENLVKESEPEAIKSSMDVFLSLLNGRKVVNMEERTRRQNTKKGSLSDAVDRIFRRK